MEDNIKIREDPAARLDRKMKNNRSNLMKQKKKYKDIQDKTENISEETNA